MDINLGRGMDGTQAAEIILKDYDIPILFLSSHTEPDVVQKTEKITSYGYVVKDSGIIVIDASIKMAFKLFDARKKAETIEIDLLVSEEIFRTVFYNSPIAIELYNHDEIVVDFNKKAFEMFGTSLKEVFGKFNLRQDPNYQTPEVWEKLDKGEEVRHLIEFDFSKTPYATNKTGKRILQIITTPVKHISPTIGYIMQIIDITDLKNIEEELLH